MLHPTVVAGIALNPFGRKKPAKKKPMKAKAKVKRGFKATATGVKRKDAKKSRTAKRASRGSIKKAGRKAHSRKANQSRALSRSKHEGATWTDRGKKKMKKLGRTIIVDTVLKVSKVVKSTLAKAKKKAGSPKRHTAKPKHRAKK